ncbi:MAG: VWA-like domain-containing protein [Streptomycetaceae bacterium]|jgi:predicted metal-dependent peptidase|nr:VWA-like domain-containing protein [Streptomycetaceae bacterium]
MQETLQVLNTEEARLRIMAAKIIAQSRWPYLSTLIFSLRIVETEDLPTLAVDAGWRMYYNPTFVLQQIPEVLATMVLHEALHCVSKHSARFEALGRENTSHEIWNLSGDANINQMLDDAKMPWGEFDPVRYESLAKYGVKGGMTTELTFFTMVKYFEDNPSKNPDHSDCGGVTGGSARGYEIPKSDMDNPSIKNDQQDVIRDRVAQDVIKHAREKGVGSVPGELLRWANELLNPQIDWKRELAGMMRSSLATVLGRKDYTYARPSRRQSSMAIHDPEFILPSMRKPAPPTIAIIIDTSGSVQDKEITEFLSEVDGIASANGIAQGITVIPCDAQVGEIQKIRSISGIADIKLGGGGGTDLRVGIAAAESLKPQPKIVIVLTDGYTPWPESIDPHIEKLIICCSVTESVSDAPSYAAVIDMTRL